MSHITYRRRKAAGLCTQCGAPRGETLLCEPCRERQHARQTANRERAERRRRQRRAAGQCWFCRQPAAPMRSLCERHLEGARLRYTPTGTPRGPALGRRRRPC